MKQDIILSGVGGQGILSIATVIGWAALDQGLFLKQAEVHGMSQRGGDVQSNLRISSEMIHSDLIPMGGCDLIISLEPMEALRYIPYLSPNGWVITNTTPFINISNYPSIEDVNNELDSIKNIIKIDADSIAKEMKAPKSSNMVLLGATASVLHILEKDKLIEGISNVFGKKGDAIVKTNIEAFNAGYTYAQKFVGQKL